MKTPASRMNEFRAAVVQTIAEKMPDLKHCESQHGRFNLDDLETKSFHLPAVRVAILQAKFNAVSDGTSSALLNCAAYCITDGKERDEKSWAISEAIASFLRPNEMFGLTGLQPPRLEKIEAVISGDIGRRGVAITVVTWQQKIRHIGQSLFHPSQDVIWPQLYRGEEKQ